MSAPERITAWAWDTDRGHGEWDASGLFGATDYVRADLVEAAVRRALEWAAGKCADNTMEIPMARSARIYAGIFCAGENTGGIHQGMGYADAIRSASPEQIAKLAKGET